MRTPVRRLDANSSNSAAGKGAATRGTRLGARRSVVFVAVSALGLFSQAIGPSVESAAASEPSATDAEAVLVDVLAAAPSVKEVTTEVTDDGALIASVAAADVVVPADASASITMGTTPADTVALGIPGNAPGVVQDGAMIYNNTAPSTDIVVQPTPAGPRTLINIDGPQAPTRVPFPASVPAGGNIALTDVGGAIVFDAEANPIATIDPVWARDSAGTAIATHLELEDNGTKLVQVIEHRDRDTQYPVVGDPFLKWVKGKLRWVTASFFVNRALVWLYERNGYQCEWWATVWTTPIACYQTAWSR